MTSNANINIKRPALHPYMLSLGRSQVVLLIAQVYVLKRSNKFTVEAAGGLNKTMIGIEHLG